MNPDDSPSVSAKGNASIAQAASGITIQHYAILVAAGAFATTFAQQRVIGKFPTTFLLKDSLHLPKEQIAIFFFWSTFAWNLKPLAGILTDAFPLFGTRRRSYMILGAGAAGALWLVMNFLPGNYTALLTASILMNVAMVFASTVMGGLMVEAGQTFGASGRIASLRQVVQSVAGIGAPLLGGYLAGKSFGWSATTMIAAGSLFALAALTFLVLREKPRRIPDAEEGAEEEQTALHRVKVPAGAYIGLGVGAVLATYLTLNKDFNSIGISFIAILAVFFLIILLTIVPTRNTVIIKAQGQLGQILKSPSLWLAVVMLFLIYTVPGLNTALTFRQTDELHFLKPYIGFMESLEGVFGVIGALIYAVVCRKFNLRFLLIGSVGINAVATLLFLAYTHNSAPLVHSMVGLVGALSELALMDLAVRSTPVGCEALGFALMMSIRNFGLALSDIIGTKMMDQYHFTFNSLVYINAGTTASILLLVGLLPRAIMSRKEGDKA